MSKWPPMRSSGSSREWIWAFSLEEKKLDWLMAVNTRSDAYSAMRNAKSKLSRLFSRFNALKSNSSGK